MGRPKQNLVYRGKTLLQRAVETALSSVCRPVTVVLGANADKIHASIENKDVIIVHNEDWQEGMASSIRCGLSALKKSAPDISSVILMLCDQPFVDADLLNAMVEKQLVPVQIIACAYNDSIGVPVLLNANYFDELLLLKGQEGAKKILLKHKEMVSLVPFVLGSFDIDTEEDYEKIQTFCEHPRHDSRGSSQKD